VSEPVTKKINYNNKTLTLNLFTYYSGSDPTPSYSWLTENMTFFAGVGGWGGTIIKGFEKWVDTLFAIQESESAGYFARRSRNIPLS
jgi:hypothetical protein